MDKSCTGQSRPSHKNNIFWPFPITPRISSEYNKLCVTDFLFFYFFLATWNLSFPFGLCRPEFAYNGFILRPSEARTAFVVYLMEIIWITFPPSTQKTYPRQHVFARYLPKNHPGWHSFRPDSQKFRRISRKIPYLLLMKCKWVSFVNTFKRTLDKVPNYP